MAAEGRSAIGTLVDRASCCLLLVHLPINRSAEATRDALIAVLGELPEAVRLTLTWDGGPDTCALHHPQHFSRYLNLNTIEHV